MGGWQQSGSRLWQAVCFQYAVYQCDDCTVGVVGIAAALEHAGVSALQAKREYIETHVGTCFIHHAYYAEGNCLPSQEQSVGQSASLQFDAERGGQCGHMTHVGGDGQQPVGGELEAVVERRSTIHACQVGSVGLQQKLRVGFYGCGQVEEYVIALPVGHGCHAQRGVLGLLEYGCKSHCA